MLYTMRSFRKIQCKDTHSFYFRIIYRNLYFQLKVFLMYLKIYLGLYSGPSHILSYTKHIISGSYHKCICRRCFFFRSKLKIKSKIYIRFISQYYTPAKCVLTVLQSIETDQRFRGKKTKLNICHQMFKSSTQLQNNSFHVVERTRRSVKCSKNEKCTCKACKTVIFHYQIWKFVTFLLPSSRNEWIVDENIYSFVRRNSSGTSY